MIPRLVLIDDEPLAVDRLTRHLAQLDRAEVVGTARGGEEGISLIERLAPDAILIDVEMPLLDGFDVVEAVARRCAGAEKPPPLVVFVTAYPQFAASAFDTGAIDFLAKPVRVPRLAVALDRIEQALADRSARSRLIELSESITRLRAQVAPPVTQERIWVSHRGELLGIEPDLLERVSAEGEYVRLHLPDRTYLHRSSIAALTAFLDEGRFIRIHRSHIVRRDCVEALVRRPAGGYRVKVRDGATLPVGRTFSGILRRLVTTSAD